MAYRDDIEVNLLLSGDAKKVIADIRSLEKITLGKSFSDFEKDIQKLRGELVKAFEKIPVTFDVKMPAGATASSSSTASSSAAASSERATRSAKSTVDKEAIRLEKEINQARRQLLQSVRLQAKLTEDQVNLLKSRAFQTSKTGEIGLKLFETQVQKALVGKPPNLKAQLSPTDPSAALDRDILLARRQYLDIVKLQVKVAEKDLLALQKLAFQDTTKTGALGTNIFRQRLTQAETAVSKVNTVSERQIESAVKNFEKGASASYFGNRFLGIFKPEFEEKAFTARSKEIAKELGDVKLANAIREKAVSQKQAFISPGRLADPKAAEQVLFGGLFGGLKGLIAGGLLATTPLGASGAVIGSTLVQASDALIRPIQEAFTHIAEKITEAGTAYESSLLGLQSILQGSTEVGGTLKEQLTIQADLAEKLQKSARARLLPLGISGATEATAVTGIFSGAAQRGITLTPDQLATISENVLGRVITQRPQLLENPTLFLRDIQDVLSGGPQANRVLLSQIIRPALPGLQRARTGEELARATQILAPSTQAARESENPLVVRRRLEGAQELLATVAGDKFLKAQTASLEKFFEVLSDERAIQAAELLGGAMGKLSVLWLDLGLSTVGAVDRLIELNNQINSLGAGLGDFLTGGVIGKFFAEQAKQRQAEEAKKKAEADKAEVTRKLRPEEQIRSTLTRVGLEKQYEGFLEQVNLNPQTQLKELQRLQASFGDQPIAGRFFRQQIQSLQLQQATAGLEGISGTNVDPLKLARERNVLFSQTVDLQKEINTESAKFTKLGSPTTVKEAEEEEKRILAPFFKGTRQPTPTLRGNLIRKQAAEIELQIAKIQDRQKQGIFVPPGSIEPLQQQAAALRRTAFEKDLAFTQQNLPEFKAAVEKRRSAQSFDTFQNQQRITNATQEFIKKNFEIAGSFQKESVLEDTKAREKINTIDQSTAEGQLEAIGLLAESTSKQIDFTNKQESAVNSLEQAAKNMLAASEAALKGTVDENTIGSIKERIQDLNNALAVIPGAKTDIAVRRAGLRANQQDLILQQIEAQEKQKLEVKQTLAGAGPIQDLEFTKAQRESLLRKIGLNRASLSDLQSQISSDPDTKKALQTRVAGLNKALLQGSIDLIGLDETEDQKLQASVKSVLSGIDSYTLEGEEKTNELLRENLLARRKAQEEVLTQALTDQFNKALPEEQRNLAAFRGAAASRRLSNINVQLQEQDRQDIATKYKGIDIQDTYNKAQRDLTTQILQEEAARQSLTIKIQQTTVALENFEQQARAAFSGEDQNIAQVLQQAQQAGLQVAYDLTPDQVQAIQNRATQDKANALAQSLGLSPIVSGATAAPEIVPRLGTGQFQTDLINQQAEMASSLKLANNELGNLQAELDLVTKAFQRLKEETERQLKKETNGPEPLLSASTPESAEEFKKRAERFQRESKRKAEEFYQKYANDEGIKRQKQINKVIFGDEPKNNIIFAPKGLSERNPLEERGGSPLSGGDDKSLPKGPKLPKPKSDSRIEEIVGGKDRIDDRGLPSAPGRDRNPNPYTPFKPGKYEFDTFGGTPVESDLFEGAGYGRSNYLPGGAGVINPVSFERGAQTPYFPVTAPKYEEDPNSKPIPIPNDRNDFADPGRVSEANKSYAEKMDKIIDLLNGLSGNGRLKVQLDGKDVAAIKDGMNSAINGVGT